MEGNNKANINYHFIALLVFILLVVGIVLLVVRHNNPKEASYTDHSIQPIEPAPPINPDPAPDPGSDPISDSDPDPDSDPIPGSDPDTDPDPISDSDPDPDQTAAAPATISQNEKTKPASENQSEDVKPTIYQSNSKDDLSLSEIYQRASDKSVVQTAQTIANKCLSGVDGNSDELEAYVRYHLIDPDSLKTIETRFSSNLQDDNKDGVKELYIAMDFTATNAYGGRVRNEAFAWIDSKTCEPVRYRICKIRGCTF